MVSVNEKKKLGGPFNCGLNPPLYLSTASHLIALESDSSPTQNFEQTTIASENLKNGFPCPPLVVQAKLQYN